MIDYSLIPDSRLVWTSNSLTATTVRSPSQIYISGFTHTKQTACYTDNLNCPRIFQYESDTTLIKNKH